MTKHLKLLMWLNMGSVGICTFFPSLNLWESLFAARFGRLCHCFSWLLSKLNFECSPDVLIPSVCQSGSQSPSCKPIRMFYNLVFNRCLEGRQCLTTPQRLEILLQSGTTPASFWDALSLCYPWCMFVALQSIASSLSSCVANREWPWEGTGVGLFPVSTHFCPC